MSRRLSLLLLLVSGLPLVGCASTSSIVGTEPTVLWEDAHRAESVPNTPLTDDEARMIARSHDAAFSCEQTARAMAKKDRQRGWQVMRECILRRDFTDLELLIDSGWASDVARDARNASLLAHVIAVRGGDVDNDLRLLRRRKMPVYSLQAALAEPTAYKGRTILVRAKAKDGRMQGDGRAFTLDETKMMAESEWVTAPGTSRSSTRTRGATRDQPTSDIAGPGVVEDTANDRTSKVEVLHNVSVTTGRSVTASVAGDAPSLEPLTDYVVVLRFEGVRAVVDDEGEASDEPIGAVVDYYEPEVGMFARLGR